MIDGYSCTVKVTLTSNNFLTIKGGNIGTITEDSWYTLEFTAEGTDFTCTLYDEDGTTVGSQTISDDAYTSGYNGLVPYARYQENKAWYVSEYTITLL